MPELTDTDLAAVKVLIAHQRLDIGSCICGWGVDTGDLGRSHSLHIWWELQRSVLPGHDARVREQVAEEIARHLMASSPPLPPPGYSRRKQALDEIAIYERAANIARAHRTTPEPVDG